MTTYSARECVIVSGQVDQTYHIGSITNTQVGTHGSIWDTIIKRYARRIQATSGGGGGYVRANEQLDPRALVDPRYSVEPAILRARESLCVTYSVAPTNGVVNRFVSWWGFGGMPNGISSAGTNAMPFVGFYQKHEISALGVVTAANTWNCQVIDDGLTTLKNTATAISCAEPHEFELVFDGTNNTIYWYIDGVLQTSYAPASNAAPGQQTPYPVVGTAAGAWNLLAAHQNTGNAQSNFLYHMSPGTPLITYQYSDT